MIDRLREIPQRILEWWNKFTTKQKTIIISVAAGARKRGLRRLNILLFDLP